MSTMRFDPVEIQRLADRIAALKERLRSSGSLPDLSEEEFGAAELAHRVHGFTSHWSDGMDRIVGELDNTTQQLAAAAAEYGGVEAEVHDAAAGR